jgi:hypothetical protein
MATSVCLRQTEWQLPFDCCQRKQKRQTSAFLLQTEMENGSLFSLGQKMINGNQQL